MNTASQLRNLKQQIFNNWVLMIKERVQPSSKIDDSALINQLPILFECIAQALEEESTQRVHDRCRDFAKDHGCERARIPDFNPDDLVQEFYLFCQVICDQLGEHSAIHWRQYHLIHETICLALRDSMISYSEEQTTFRERFIATLTHDLRNPIGAAKMAAELIGQVTDDPTEVAALAEQLKLILKRADHMLQSLLDVAYMRSGYELHYKMEEFNLREVILDVIRELKLTHGERFDFDGDDVFGFWNKSAVVRAIENLLSNALKYGAIDRPIKVQFERIDGHVQIRVHNDGRPIPIADQERIFQPFKREQAALETKPGWGLGLCYVQSATEAHGGHVKVHSDAQSGTDFYIDLPLDSRH